MTRPEDVVAACELGVDAVGFVCYPHSPRFVPPERLSSLVAELPPLVTPVLLFVDAEADQIEDALQTVPHALLQFHGTEPHAECARFGRAYLRAVSMSDDVDLLDWEKQYPTATALLADSASAGFGGSGRTFDWNRLPPQERRAIPLILAGGLNASNVGDAIRAAWPYGVDVSSGVETERGIKSEALMRGFVAAVLAAHAGTEDETLRSA
jgi:phosphoribosylanthranilate isomerase